MVYRKAEAKFEKLYFEDINEGFQRKLRHKITEDDVNRFADLTGDYNPVHLDNDFARQAGFGKRVVHGMLTSSFISTMIGMLIPGPGALWTSQTLNFLGPSHIDDEIEVTAVVKKKSIATRQLVLSVKIVNQKNQVVVDGESTVKMLETKKKNLEVRGMNNVVLITGAAKGIGAAIVRKLVSDGKKVVVNYVSSSEKANALVSEVSENGGQAIAIRADVTNATEVEAMFREIESTFGAVGGLVHCASITPIPESLEQVRYETINKHLDVQIKGAYNCVQYALPSMKESKFGSIVFIGSIFTEGVPPVKQMAYTIAKSALVSMSKSLAVELGPHGVRVNVVSPGMTHTEMIADIPEKAKMVAKMNTPLRKLADPEEIAGVVSFLLSDGARHISGENIKVCGGLVM